MKISRYAIKTDQGPILGNNEDGHLVDLELDLFMVMDGFGGVGIGDKAVEMVKQDVSHFLRHFGGDVDSTMPFFYGHRYLLEANALINALYLSHQNLLQMNLQVPISSRSGVCLAGVIFSANLATLIGVGNVRAYLIRGGAINKVINDDSLNQVLKNCDYPALGTFPASALGLFQDFQFSTTEIRTEKGDLLLFLSDGVFSSLGDVDIFQSCSGTKNNLMPRIDNLFGQANSRGNQDNQTALIIEI